MAISIKRYVDITSGVGAGINVAGRNLMGRFFSTNPLIPTHSFIEFNTAEEVGDYFGTSSTEYLRALFYFDWVSKLVRSPNAISFARWVDAAAAPRIYGSVGTQAVGSYTGITAGTFTLTLGDETNLIDGLDFSTAVSLSDVAAEIQAEIRTNTGTMWTAATVTWDATRGSFNLVGGDTGDAVIEVVAGTGGSDVAAQLGWLSVDTILSDGSDVQSVTDCLTESADASNNFGSFTFIPTLTQDQIVEAAEWNDARNVEFIYSVRCTSSNAAALSAALADISGVTLTLAPLATEYPEQAPMMILAATNYNAANSVQNYMFQIFELTPSVETDLLANTYDDLLVNYYGQTQTAGQFLRFYQRGVMMGIASDPRDQNVYANEIWLKDSASAAIMTVLLGLARIPANNQGRAIILSILQSVINQALSNGTISAGKVLTEAQKQYIQSITGDANAYRQVQTDGYWVDVVIVPEVISGITQYKAVYTLVYSKDDVIRKVVGSDILI